MQNARKLVCLYSKQNNKKMWNIFLVSYLKFFVCCSLCKHMTNSYISGISECIIVVYSQRSFNYDLQNKKMYNKKKKQTHTNIFLNKNKSISYQYIHR